MIEQENDFYDVVRALFHKKKVNKQKKRLAVSLIDLSQCLYRNASGRPFGNGSLPSYFFTGFRLVTSAVGFTGFYQVVNRFYWVLLGFTGFYWVLLGFSGLRLQLRNPTFVTNQNKRTHPETGP